MKRSLALFLSLLALPLFAEAAQSVAAKMVCESVRLEQGHDTWNVFTLDVSSYDPSDPSVPPNGELLPTRGSAYSRVAYFAMDDTGFDPMVGVLFLNVPSVADPVTGMNSFFEVSQGISATSAGNFQVNGASGAVTATWTRNANSSTGTCELDFGSFGVFTHRFSIAEYSGRLTYTPGASLVPGTIALTNSVDPSQWITGSVQFVKSDSNPADALALQPVSWTNATGAAMTISDLCPVYRETEQGTNYDGFVTFADGDLNTPTSDYTSWFLYFTDLNDSNQNGIPDFSDALVVQPGLAISLGTTNVLLSFSGALNSTGSILQASDVGATNWLSVQSFTITNDPQVISMPFSPTNEPTFWRVQLQ